MASTFILIRKLPGIARNAMLPSFTPSWASSSRMSTTFNSDNISQITEKEKELTCSDQPVKGGPTAQAQKHAGQQLNSRIIADTTRGEQKITREDSSTQSGPASLAQSMLTQSSGTAQDSHPGKLDSSTISKITEAEKGITHQKQPMKGGPTAQAQKHAGEAINSSNLHDITEGEKKITGGDRAKGAVFRPEAQSFQPLGAFEQAQFDREIRYVLADSAVQAADEKLASASRELDLCQRNVRVWAAEKKANPKYDIVRYNASLASMRFCGVKVEEAQEMKKDAYDKRGKAIDELVMDAREGERVRRLQMPIGEREWERKWELEKECERK